VILDISTIAVVGSECAKYLNLKTTTQIVKLDDWGVNIELPVDATVKVDNSIAGKSVVIETNKDVSEKVTAPGYEDGSAICITGTATKAVKVTYKSEVEVDNISKWTVADDEQYFPIKFTAVEDGTENNIGQVTLKQDGTAYKATLEGEYTKSYSKNDDVNLTVGTAWLWDYENNENIALYDTYDTALGNTAASDGPVAFKVNSTVTLEWDTPSNSGGGGGTTPDPEPDDDTDDATPTPTILAMNPDRTLSGEGGAAITPDRTLSGDAGEDNGIIEPGRTLSGAVNTGDSFNMLVWIIVMAAAAVVITIAIVLLFVFNRKEEKGSNAETHN
jgi:hypothetical protein